MASSTPTLSNNVETQRIRDLKGKGKARDIDLDLDTPSHEKPDVNGLHHHEEEGGQAELGGSLLRRVAVGDQVRGHKITRINDPFSALVRLGSSGSSNLTTASPSQEVNTTAVTDTPTSQSAQLQAGTHHHHNPSDPLCTSCTSLLSHLHAPLSSPFTHLLSKTTRHIPRTSSEEHSIHTVISTGLSRITEIENAELKLKALMDDLKREKRKVEAWVDDHRVMIAPVWTLPPEVLSEIFVRVVGFEDGSWDEIEYAAPSSASSSHLMTPSSTSGTIPTPTDREREKRARGEITRASIRSSVRLSWVCRQWRDVALHTPQLWTRICVVELPPPEEIAELRMRLGVPGATAGAPRKEESVVDDLEASTSSGTGTENGTGSSLTSSSNSNASSNTISDSHSSSSSISTPLILTTSSSTSSSASKLPMPLISLLRTGTSLPLDLHFKTSKPRDIIDYFLPVKARWRRVVFDACVGVGLMMRLLSGEVHVGEVNGRVRSERGLNTANGRADANSGGDADRWKVVVDSRGELRRVAVGEVSAERDSDDELSEGVAGSSQTQRSRNGVTVEGGKGEGGSRTTMGGEKEKERRFPMLEGLEFRGVPTPDLRETGWVVGDIWRPPVSVIAGGPLPATTTNPTVTGNGNGNAAVGPAIMNVIVAATIPAPATVVPPVAIQIPGPSTVAPGPAASNLAEEPADTDPSPTTTSAGDPSVSGDTIPTTTVPDGEGAESSTGSTTTVLNPTELGDNEEQGEGEVVGAVADNSVDAVSGVTSVDDATTDTPSGAEGSVTSPVASGSTTPVNTTIDPTITDTVSADLSTASASPSGADTSTQTIGNAEDAEISSLHEEAIPDSATPIASGSGTTSETTVSTSADTSPSAAATSTSNVPPAPAASPATTPAVPVAPPPAPIRTSPIPHPKLNPLTLFTPHHAPNLTSLCSVQMFGIAYTVLPLSLLRRYEGPVQVGDYVRLLSMMPVLEELFVQPVRSAGGGLGMGGLGGGGGGGGMVAAPPLGGGGGAPGQPQAQGPPGGGAPGPLPGPGIMNGALASLLEPESSASTPPHLHLRHLHISSSSIASTLSFSLMAGGGGPPWLLTQLQHLPPLPSLSKLFLYFDKRFIPPQPERTLYPFFEKNGGSLKEVVWGLSLGVDGVRRCLERCAAVEVLHVHRICGDGLLRVLEVQEERPAVGRGVRRGDGASAGGTVSSVVIASETTTPTTTTVAHPVAGSSSNAGNNPDGNTGATSQISPPRSDGNLTVSELLSALALEMGSSGMFEMTRSSTPGASGSGSAVPGPSGSGADEPTITPTVAAGGELENVENSTNDAAGGEQSLSALDAAAETTVVPTSTELATTSLDNDGSVADTAGESSVPTASASTSTLLANPAVNATSTGPQPPLLTSQSPSASPSTSSTATSSPTTSPSEPARPILVPNLRVLRISGKIVLRVEMLEKVVWSRCEGGRDGRMRIVEADDETSVEPRVKRDLKGKGKARAVDGDDEVEFGPEAMSIAAGSSNDLNGSTSAVVSTTKTRSSGTDAGDSEETHIRSGSDDAGSDEDKTPVSSERRDDVQSVPWLLREVGGPRPRQTPDPSSQTPTPTNHNPASSTPSANTSHTQHAIQGESQPSQSRHPRALRELHFLPARLEKLDNKSRDRIVKMEGEKTGMVVVVRQLDRAAFLSRRF